jgi:hypothetical protein
VKRDLLQATDADRGKIVLMLQAPELALDGGTSPVKVSEALSVARDAREQTPAGSMRAAAALAELLSRRRSCERIAEALVRWSRAA